MTTGNTQNTPDASGTPDTTEPQTPPTITSAVDLLAAYAAGQRDFAYRVSCPYDAILRGAILRDAILRDADLRGAILRDADLRDADLRGADLRGAILRGADLRDADLTGAILRDANLRRADLTGAILRDADLTGAQGLLDAVDWLMAHCAQDAEGLIVYKTFGANYSPPDTWEIASGAIISEVVNPDRGTECACGINVATRDWQRQQGSTRAWRCRIRWPWLAGVVVPFGTDGKFRCSRLELLAEVRLADEPDVQAPAPVDAPVDAERAEDAESEAAQ